MLAKRNILGGGIGSRGGSIRVELRANFVQRMPGPKPLEIERWAIENRINLGLAWAAQVAVAAAEPFFQLASEAGATKMRARLPELPVDDQWLRFYRRHRELWRKMGDKVSSSRMGTRLVKGHAGLRIVIREREEVLEAIKRADQRKLRACVTREMKVAWRAYRRHLEELRGEFQEQSWELREDLENQLRNCPEMHFAMAVVLPCAVHFRTSPGQLMRRARSGNVNAIENLIRLDDATINDPAIRRWRLGGKGDVRQGLRQQTGEWIKDGIVGELNRKRVKQMLGGLISLLAEEMAMRFNSTWTKVEKYKLTAPQIKALFDAAARDRKVAVTGKDRDISGCLPGAWAKAVERYRDIWKIGLGLCSDKENDK